MKRYVVIVLLLLPFFGMSQNLDSLYQEAQLIKNDSLKLDAYKQVGFKYIFNKPDKAIKILNEGATIAKEKSNNYGLANIINTQGIYMDVTGQSDSAQFYFKKALKISEDFGFEDIQAKSTNNLGLINWNNGNFEEALTYFFKALEMEEANDRKEATANPLNNIGLIYQDMGLYDKALEYHKKSLEVRREFNDFNRQISSLNNIGIVLKEQNKIDEAIKTYKQAIDLAKQENNLQELIILLENLGNAYNINDDINLAISTYLESVEVAKKFEGHQFKLWSVYNNLAAAYNELNQPERALFYLEKGFSVIKKFPEVKSRAAELYITAAETNYMLDNFKEARTYKERFVTLRDSIFSNQNAEAMAELDVKYETQKKEREILEQRAVIAEKEVVLQRRSYQTYGALGFALILGLIGYLFYNQLKLKNVQLQKDNELKDALVKIETQNKLQEQRLRISRDLHDNIGAQLTFIISSIDNLKYGFELPQKLEAKLTSISSFTNETIFELRDTIWAMNKDEITFEDLQIRISNFVNKANLASQNIQFNFQVDENIKANTIFTSLEGINMYRIIQEAINNALKYANPTKVDVLVRQNINKLNIDIIDNGNGFDIATVQLGNGLNNMKKRAHEIGAEFSVSSNNNEDTTIKIEI